MKQYFQISIRGLVQGVGFRPFIYRIAVNLGLHGSVENRNDGVKVILEADNSQLQAFLTLLNETAPPASKIESVEVEEINPQNDLNDFTIVKSTSISEAVTEVSPDIAVCEECLSDMKVQKNRLDYPFINCTNCGPRFTIISDLPYDREKTSMQPFVMCESCAAEYREILDRRFHAQPVACADCGPVYTLHSSTETINAFPEVLRQVLAILESGEVLAVKGMGGYFIACNAMNEAACQKIRAIKLREGKPFALMFRDMETIRNFADVTDAEASLLTSFRRPIVLLKQKYSWPKAVNSGLNSIGCMLPYMPFHHLLFERSNLQALVMTSGNFSDEPIFIDDEKAVAAFLPQMSAVLSYNREIVNRCDDSVLFVANEKARIIRRSRGFVPGPVRTSLNLEGIMGCGAELKNTFCIGKGDQAILSQHIGDLKNAETYDFYKESIQRFQRLFRCNPSLMAVDMHPDYLSTKYAAESGLPIISIQHHYAHIASVLAEHRFFEKVIGVSFDGTGLGDDSAVWGGEFLLCDLKGYERVAHLSYVPLPGGDAAASQPWRMAVSYLNQAFGKSFLEMDLPFLRELDRTKVEMLLQGMDKDLNCPPTSSAGRLFDAVSALNGICLKHSFEAEGPMLLESMIDTACSDLYPFDYKDGMIIFDDMFREMTNDILAKKPISFISTRFHNTLVQAIVETCLHISRATSVKAIALSGGVFQNAFVLGKTESILQGAGLKVLSNHIVPVNDGGISLGQIAVAAST